MDLAGTVNMAARTSVLLRKALTRLFGQLFPQQHFTPGIIIRNEYQQDADEHKKIETVDSPGLPMRHENQTGLEMDEGQVDENQGQIEDFFFQVKETGCFHPFRAWNHHVRPGFAQENFLGRQQNTKKEKGLGDRKQKEQKRFFRQDGLPFPKARPERHLLGQPGISVNGHHPADAK